MTPRPFLRGLRAVRQRKALSQEALGQLANVAASTIIRLENLQTGANPTTTRRLADALGVEPAELVGE